MQSSRTDDPCRHLRPTTILTSADMFAEAKRRFDSGDKQGTTQKLADIRQFCGDDKRFLTEAVECGLGVPAERLLAEANAPKVPRFARTPVDPAAASLHTRSNSGTFATAVRF